MMKEKKKRETRADERCRENVGERERKGRRKSEAVIE